MDDNTRNLYVQMSSGEYEKFKNCKDLNKYSPEELAAALIESIKRSGQGSYNEQLTNAFKNEYTSVAKYVKNQDLTIVLQIILRK